MLSVSFSSNDAIGHTWGPDSQEVFDVTLRSDVIMRDLLNYLDEKVGHGKYLLALTADHGVCRVPEISQALGKDAGRLSIGKLQQAADEFLEAEFGGGGNDKPRWIKSIANGWVYLDEAKLSERGIELAQAEYSLRQWLLRQPGIFSVFTDIQLKSGVAKEDVLGQRVLRSYHAERSGNVLIILKPFWLPGDAETGTTHGSPFGYDSHVPLLVLGPQVTPGTRSERVSPLAIASIFAHALGMKPPADSDTPLPEGLFKE